MGDQERRAAYASLWILALAFAWIEASVVVYLREIYVLEVSLQPTNYLAGLQVSLVSLPSHLVAVEMAREACTILLLGAVAWLAGRRPADRAGAFLLSIPLPWVAPVWGTSDGCHALRRCRQLHVLDVGA